MAIRAIGAWNVLGYGISSAVAMNIQSSVVMPNEPFAWKLDVVSGSPNLLADGGAGLIRSKNNSSWNTVTLSLSAVWYQCWHQFDQFPTDQEFLTVLDSTNALNCTFRIRTDGKIRFHDFSKVASGTATATADNAITAGSKVRIRIGLNYTAQTLAVLVYNTSGTLVASASASSVNFNGATFGRFVQSWQYQFPIDGGGWEGDSAATFTWYYGIPYVDDADYPDANIRTSVQWATAEGTHTGWSLGAGASKAAAVSGAPLDGNTSYIVSTTANAAQTFTLQTCASAGISGTILACLPFMDPWDLGGSVQSQGRIIEGATTTTSTAVARGSTVDLHLACPLYNSTLPSGAALTIANMNAMEVGIVRANNTTEIRCGAVGNIVVYVPPAVDAPTVTSRLQNIAYNDATVQTTVAGDTITARGVCWSTSANPTTSDSKTTDSTGSGDLVSRITGLSANTVYYARAYATNAGGTTYSTQMQFTSPRDHDTDIGVRGAFERDAPRRASRRR